MYLFIYFIIIIYLFCFIEDLCVAKHVTVLVHRKGGFTGNNQGQFCIFLSTDLVHRKEGITGVNQGQFCIFVSYIFYLFIYLLVLF